MKILLELAYEGTGYNGWQSQASSGHSTVQEALEDALEQVTGQRIRTLASGRTDAGVHALCQPVQFITDRTIPPERYKPALNSYLPDDIRILRSRQVSDDFHAIASVCTKTYLYRILRAEDPDVFRRKRIWHLPYALSMDSMRQAASLMEGTHDFRAFCSSRTDVKMFIRTVKEVSVGCCGDETHIRVTGNGFLHNMVRIMVGTITEIGQGRMTLSTLQSALATGDRTQAGPTAPAAGLYLESVLYDPVLLQVNQAQTGCAGSSGRGDEKQKPRQLY